MTSRCTTETCGYAERYPQFREKDAVAIGVSIDSVASHKKFEDEYHRPFFPNSHRHAGEKAPGVFLEKEGKIKAVCPLPFHKNVEFYVFKQ